MNISRERQLVVIVALGLTALLSGVFVGGMAVYYNSREQMRDPDYLRKQLAQLSPENGNAKGGPPPALVRVSVAERKDIQPQRSIVGRLTEVRKVTIASEVTGKITEMPVELGTPVVGDETLLARVDDVWSRLALDRCKAQMASTEAQLKYELSELQRSERLSQTDAVTDSELESLRSTVDDLQAKLAQCKTAVDEETERIARSTILAPFDGTVVTKHVELGGHVEPGDPVVDIVSRGQVDAKLMVPESMVNLIALDQVLTIQIDSLREEVSGKVVSVTPYGPTASRTFPVRVRLDDKGGRLKVGMSVTAQIATGLKREALVVTRDAVLVRPDSSTVWVALPQRDGEMAEVQPVPVAISARMRDECAVEAETDAGRKLLVAGAAVVIEGAERLMPGQQVRIVELDGGSTGVVGPADPAQPKRAEASSKDAKGSANPRES